MRVNVPTDGQNTAFFQRAEREGGFRCQVCQSLFGPKNMSKMDHCHETGHHRGMLCHACNVGIGWFRDNPRVLVRAAEYLLRFGHDTEQDE